MIFEIVTTTIMGSIALKAHLSKTGASNDSQKLNKIFSLSGLNVKDGKQTITTQLLKKTHYSWGTEYKYRIPLGKSFDDYKAKFRTIEDGLNNKRQMIKLKDLKGLQLDKTLPDQLKELNRKKLGARKEVELSFDGLLCVRVYNEPLPKEVSFEVGTGWKVIAGQTREKNKKAFLDFETYPHVALGGATRYGKSNFLNSIIVSLLESNPEHVKFHLIDLKGGVELCDYERLNQTVSIAYETEEALEVLKGAYEDMRAVQQRLKKLGKKKVQDAGIKERHFIIIDEVGELNPEEAIGKDDKKLKEACQLYMSKIARLGAGLGFRQILATQYPTGDVIPRQCKQNSDAKICFRVQNATASRVVLDSEGAELLPQVKGRAIFQTADKRTIIQTPLLTSEAISKVIKQHDSGVSKRKDVSNIENEQTTNTATRGNSAIVEKTRFS
ncbi:FtsK/SpoIIIE domain-containing protein [Peribacillus simplex]|uniref:FtsK/SpoIIIE domain-containing protein n=1 Tax=Peribacillus simplex TaxID=1478 RepID=UPI0011A132B2|nr:FtsK/SpoIIIE domain-containing protein [Peribacillus simplex]